MEKFFPYCGIHGWVFGEDDDCRSELSNSSSAAVQNAQQHPEIDYNEEDMRKTRRGSLEITVVVVVVAVILSVIVGFAVRQHNRFTAREPRNGLENQSGSKESSPAPLPSSALPPSSNPNPDPAPSPSPTPVPAGDTNADFYVSPAGNDSWSGTLAAPNDSATDGPFATIDRARRAAQTVGKSGRTTPVVIALRGGTYALAAPISFSAADSGTSKAPVVYENYGTEVPVVSGGVQITGFKNTAGGAWTVDLDAAKFKNFAALFYNGERRYRPRTSKSGYLYNAGPVSGYFDRFYFKDNDIASTYHGIGLGDVEVLDFEKWTMSRMRLSHVDILNHVAYLTGPTQKNSDNSGFLVGHRYLLENVKEALNMGGEWYLDRCPGSANCTVPASSWTLTYLAKSGEDPSRDSIVVPQATQLIVANGLQYVTFKGIIFSYQNWVTPAEGLGDRQGIPDVPAALSFANSSNVVLDSDVVSRVEGWGAEFIGTSVNNQVVNNVFFDLGAGGVRIGSYPSQSNNSETAVPDGNVVENNMIEGGGRTQPSGIGTGIWVNAHRTAITHNDVHDFYSGAIALCVPTPVKCPFAHDNTISYNHVYNLGQGVTSDFGGIYVATFAAKGNQILNNKINDITHDYQDADGYGGQGIYLDNQTQNVLVQNNLVYRVSESTAFNNRGAHNTWMNNIFAFGRTSEIKRGDDDLDARSFDFTHNIVYFDMGTVQYAPGQWACAKNDGTAVPCTERFNFDSNLYWDAAGDPVTFAVNNPQDQHQTLQKSFVEWQASGEDVHSFLRDPLFADPQNGNFTLRSGSPASNIGFVAFDANEAGRTSATYTPPPVPGAFPVQSLDPKTGY